MNKQTLLLVLTSFFIFINVMPAIADRAIERNSETTPSKRLALVIGNSEYTSSPLKNPVNDAQDIAIALKQNGFKVILLRDAGQQEMEKAIKEFGKRLRSGGVGLFYFAGHGIQYNGRNYLIPVDAQIEDEADVKYEAVDAGRVLSKMEVAGNGLNIVILDACRNNPFARSFRSADQGLAKMDAPTGSLIAYATSPGSVAADGEGSNGVYTKYLLKYISQPGLAIERVFKQVRKGVLSETGGRQTPWESSSLTGDFNFAVGNKLPASQPETAVITSFNGEDEFWKAVQDSTDKNDFQSYIDAYPGGRFTAVAKFKLSKLQPEAVKARMFIRPTPSDAKIHILRPDLRYYDGIELPAGSYSVEISKQGYITRVEVVTLDDGENKSFSIKLIAKSDNHSSGQIYTDSITGMEFVYVKGGCYQMGDTFGDGGNQEKPVHEVCVDSFWIGKYEVTQGEYEQIVGSNPADFKNGSTYPVEQVSWNDARIFISKLNSRANRKFRLPSEAEWEYASRSAGRNERFAGGNFIDSVAWYADNSSQTTHRVGTKSANGLGLYDMSGNVWEWCSDRYGKSYYKSSPQNNPQGPPAGSYRVLRGGSWNRMPRVVRTSYRGRGGPDNRSNNMGMRLVFYDASW